MPANAARTTGCAAAAPRRISSPSKCGSNVRTIHGRIQSAVRTARKKTTGRDQTDGRRTAVVPMVGRGTGCAFRGGGASRGAVVRGGVLPGFPFPGGGVGVRVRVRVRARGVAVLRLVRAEPARRVRGEVGEGARAARESASPRRVPDDDRRARRVRARRRPRDPRGARPRRAAKQPSRRTARRHRVRRGVRRGDRRATRTSTSHGGVQV